MNSSYNRHNSARKFTSVKTFIRVFFSWASNQCTEFREACNWCGFSPKILACDATKIGISASSASINPIETPKNETPLKIKHRKNNRCFLPYPSKDSVLSVKDRKDKEKKIREARAHMKAIMKSIGMCCQNNEVDETFELRNRQLLDVFPSLCKPLLRRVFSQNLSLDQLSSATQLFYMLSFESPLRAFLPQPLLEAMTFFTESSLTSQILNEFLFVARKYNIYISQFVCAFVQTNPYKVDDDANNLLRYLCQATTDIHQDDIKPEAASFIADTYNPPKFERAYYFNEEGTQIRETRKFECNNSKIGDSSNEACTKKYPQVAKSGSTFLFLWFCPLHGHCYGGHIVNGSEGRKDPACSLYNHLEVAPEIIYYNFACSLEEYCMNREAGYFKNKQFFYDIFHGYNHTCSKIYSSKNLIHLNSVNSSICEQFNSYLQCIKSSAKQMSQEHFMFFLQYMIRLWNEKKKKSFMKKLNIALSGSS